MPTTNHSQDRPRRLRLGWVVIGVVILAVASGVTFIYRAAEAALQMEQHLQASLYTLKLTDSFVKQKGHWPTSWAELEATEFAETLDGRGWPAGSKDLQRLVTIDFTLSAEQIIQQDPDAFTAVKPTGRSYEYQHYGYIELLQQTLRKSQSVEQPEMVP